MTVELWYLFLSSLLLAFLWIPYIVGQVMTNGPLTPQDYTELRGPEQTPNWVRRANRAHVNMVEQFGAFAGLVVIAHLASISNSVTEISAAVFFFPRVAHAVVFVAGINQMMARTIIFTVGWLAMIVFAAQILFSA